MRNASGWTVRENATVTIPEERRLVTVLFADLVGFTSRSDASDPEDVREMQRAYFEAVAAEVQRYGGTVEKYIGDAVMALYGAPQAHDDDAERALHAALGIRGAVAGLASGLEVRIGVNTGEVVGGAGSGPQAHEYTVTGDAVNVAARLQQAAEPGEIFVGPTTRRLAAEAFDFAPLPPLELKGKPEPVEAWRLARALPQRPRVRGGEAPLVGRRREQLLLEAALESAKDGHGLLVGMSGEAGIGKSRLALELRQRAEADGFETTWAAALSYAASFPFHLVAALADQLLPRAADRSTRDLLLAAVPDADPELLDRWAAILADISRGADPSQEALLAGATPDARQRLLVGALGAVINARAAARPQLIVLDDLHWADASSLSVLDELLTIVPQGPIVVLALHRPGWSNRWASRSFYQQVNLDRLRDDEARQLVAALSAGSSIDAGRTDQLLHRSGGNPFFLEELLRAGSDGTAALPETLHELLLARIDGLPAAARAVLGVAAVIGMEFGAELLAAVEPSEGLPEALAALQADELIVARGGDLGQATYAMRHPLVHEVAYRSLLVARRRVLHRRIGAWLEEHGGEEALPAIAAHYRDGDDPDRAREFLPRAADRARRINAPSEARAMYLEAADLLSGQPVRRAEMLERAAHLSYLVGEMGQAIAQVSEAERLYAEAGERLHALDCHRQLARYYWMDGHGKQAEAEIVVAIRGLEEFPHTPELAHAYSAHAQLRMLMPDHAEGERLARKAIEVADEVGSIEAKVHALNNLGTSRMGLGDPGGIEDLRTSLALALEHNLPDDAGRAYTNLCAQGSAISFFDVDETQALFEEMLAYDRKVAPGGAFEQWHRAAQAEQGIPQGRWEDAAAKLSELESIVTANRYLQVDVAAYGALLAAYRGRCDEALRTITPFVEAAAAIDDLQAFAPAQLALAHAERGSGHDESAVAAIERGISLRGDSSETNLSSWYLFEAVDVVAWLARDIGADAPLVRRAAAALDGLTRSFRERVTRPGTPAEVLVRRALFDAGDATLQMLGGDGTQLDRLRAAAADLRTSKRVFDAARAELWLAEASGDRAAAAAALETFTSIRATDYAGRAREAATATG